MDVETFFMETRGSVTDLIAKDLTDLESAKVQMTAWIGFKVEVEDEDRNIIRVDTVDKAFNSQMMEVLKGSNLNEIINEMFTHLKTQVENPALANSRFVFDRVLFLDVNFYHLNLTRGSSYLPLPDWTASKKAVINPQNEEDEKCFKWAVIAALQHKEIGNNPQRITKLRRFEGNYEWGGLEFPIALNNIDVFKWKNDVSVNVLAIGGWKEKLYILRKSKFNYQGAELRRTANLHLIDQEEKRQYAAIKNLSRLLGSSNSRDRH